MAYWLTALLVAPSSYVPVMSEPEVYELRANGCRVVVYKPPKPCRVTVKGIEYDGVIQQWTQDYRGWIAVCSYFASSWQTFCELAPPERVRPRD